MRVLSTLAEVVAKKYYDLEIFCGGEDGSRNGARRLEMPGNLEAAFGGDERQQSHRRAER
jgi:hypothetical protein